MSNLKWNQSVTPLKTAQEDVEVLHLFWYITDVFVRLDCSEMLSMCLLLQEQMSVFLVESK